MRIPFRCRSRAQPPIPGLVNFIAVIVAVAPAAVGQPLAECGTPETGWVFCTGFEEGDLGLWDDWDGNPPETNLLMADPGPFAKDGNHVVRLRVPAGRGLADLTKVLPQSYDRLYARWYAKWEPGFDFSTLQHGGGLHAGDRGLLAHSDDRPLGDDWFSAWIEPGIGTGRFNAYTYYRGMYMNCADPVGSCWGDDLPCVRDDGASVCVVPEHRETAMPPLMEADRWYCIELMLDAGTPVTDEALADGRLDFWIDGVEVGPVTKLWLRTTDQLRIGILWLSLFFHDQHGVPGVLIDDVVVSTAPIGVRTSGVAAEGRSWGQVKGSYR